MAVALATLAAGLADATPVTINVSANPGGVVQVTGDPAVAPLVLPGLGWPPSNGIAPGALFTQDLAQLSLTNLTIGCGVIGGCTYRYDIQTQPLNVAATGLVVRLDGNVSTTNAAGADAWLSLQLYSRANNPNPYDTNVYSLVVPRFGVTGAFDTSWYQAPIYPVGTPPGQPVTVGVTRMFLDIGLGYGDSVTLPGSMGMNFSAPPQSVPDAGSSLLLLGIGLAGLRAWRKRLG